MFRIDDNRANRIVYFNIYTNPTDAVSRNFMTTRNSMSIQYYCVETGYKDKRMYGTLLIEQPLGNNNSSSSNNSLSSNEIMGYMVNVVKLVK